MAKNVLRAELKLENRRAVQNAKQATQATRQFGKQGVESTDKVTTATGKLGAAVMGMVGAYAGMAGARMVMQALREETERIDRASRSAMESMRAVLALTALQGRRPEEIARMKQMAGVAGRPLGEVSQAYYTLLGGTAGMAPQRQAGLMQQVLQFAKTDPSAGLDPLVNLFTTMASQQPGMTPQQISNLLSMTIERAKARPEEMAQALPGILAVAQAGKVPVTMPAAMFAFATRKGGGVAVSGTAVRAAMLGLIRPAKDVEKRLVALGFNPQASVLEKIRWVAKMGDQLPTELQAALGGRRGIQAISGIAAAPEEFAQEQRIMERAMAAPEDLIQQRLAGMYGEVPAQRYLTQIQQLETLTALEDIKPQEMREKAILALRALRRRKRATPIMRKLEEWGEAAERAITGKVPFIGPDPLEALILEGYPAAEVGGLLDVTGPEGGYDEQVDWYRGELKRRGAGLMQGPGGQQVSIGIQYNILESTRASLLGKQQWALASAGGVA